MSQANWRRHIGPSLTRRYTILLIGIIRLIGKMKRFVEPRLDLGQAGLIYNRQTIKARAHHKL